MIYGNCPHCTKPIRTPMGPAPCFSKEKCEECEKEHWLYHSHSYPFRYEARPESVGKVIPKTYYEKVEE